MVKRNIAQYTLHQVTNRPAKFEVAASQGQGEDVFTRKYNVHTLTLEVNVTGNFATYPFASLTYAPAKFEVATSKV